MSLLEESLAIATELGMRPLMERVLSRRDILKALPMAASVVTGMDDPPQTLAERASMAGF